jgi:DNA repair protein RadD
MSLFAPIEEPPSVRELRDYQSGAIDELRQALREGCKRPLLQAPTGAGKTRIAGAIIDMARAKGNTVAFCVPALSLIDQTVESFSRDGIEDIGVIQADHVMTNWRAAVQVCSIDTLARRGFPNVKMVIVDEAHRKSETIVKWMAEKPDMIFIGLSATPWAKGLGKHYDRLIIVTTIAGLIERGYLAPMRVFAPAHPDLSAVKTVAGEYHEGQLSDAMDKPALVADVVETWIKLGEARPTLVFAVDRAHAKHLQLCFEGAGIRAGYQDAYTDPAERARIRDEFKRGLLEVVCNVGTLTTGVDWDVRCIVLARPTKSEMLHVQIIGRGLRTADGKADCLILDHSDNHHRLGFVTDIHHQELDDGKDRGKAENRKPPVPKECASCHYLRPPKVLKCPACGFQPVATTNIDMVDGELREFTPGGKKSKDAVAGHIVLRGVAIPHRQFYAMLMSHAAGRGYKPGFAAAKYKDAIGGWPPRGWAADKPIDASYEVAQWLRSQQIKYAKRRPAEASGHHGE